MEITIMIKRKFLVCAAIAVSLTACQSQPEKPAEVVEKVTPTTPPPSSPPSATTAKATPTPSAAVNPLKDPKNILSQRSAYFDYDSYAIKEEAKPLITAHAKYLSQNRTAKIRIEGHCDERGTREYNLALGQRRADAVKKILLLLGATENQVETVSFGKEKPRNTSSNEAAWAENRRGDIVYQGE